MPTAGWVACWNVSLAISALSSPYQVLRRITRLTDCPATQKGVTAHISGMHSNVTEQAATADACA